MLYAYNSVKKKYSLQMKITFTKYVSRLKTVFFFYPLIQL